MQAILTPDPPLFQHTNNFALPSTDSSLGLHSRDHAKDTTSSGRLHTRINFSTNYQLPDNNRHGHQQAYVHSLLITTSPTNSTPLVRTLGTGLALWILAIPIFLFTLFPLISSTAKTLSGIYLLEWQWYEPSNPSTKIWFRIGYYGLCWVGGDFHTSCVRTTGQSTSSIAKHFNFDKNDSNYQNSLDTISFGLELQRSVFVAFMTAGGIDWLISLVLVTLVVLANGRAAGWLRTAAKFTAGSAAILMIASAWSTGQAVGALEAYAKYGSFTNFMKGGNLLVGLQWTAAVLSCFFAWGVAHVCSRDGGKGDAGYSYDIGR